MPTSTSCSTWASFKETAIPKSDSRTTDFEAIGPGTALRRPKRPPGSPASQQRRCHLENGPGLDLQTARRIACDAALVAVLEHVGEGEPLRLGRKTRTISAAQRRALRIRDGGCQFPGCHRLRFLEAHHAQQWSHLGPTDLENLVLVCRFHHMLVHEGGYRVGALKDQGWIFHNPRGAAIPRVPRPVVIDGPHEPSATHKPDDLLPGWSGEPFHLWATVAALQDNPRPDPARVVDAA